MLASSFLTASLLTILLPVAVLTGVAVWWIWFARSRAS